MRVALVARGWKGGGGAAAEWREERGAACLYDASHVRGVCIIEQAVPSRQSG